MHGRQRLAAARLGWRTAANDRIRVDMEESHPPFSQTITRWVAMHIKGSTVGSLIEDAARTKGALEQVVPYESPCPYSGYRNGYSISLYALSAPLPTNGGTLQEEILHGSLAKTTLTGWYEIK